MPIALLYGGKKAFSSDEEVQKVHYKLKLWTVNISDYLAERAIENALRDFSAQEVKLQFEDATGYKSDVTVNFFSPYPLTLEEMTPILQRALGEQLCQITDFASVPSRRYGI